ncbi:MAG: hypothetical protein M0R21_10865 [Lentimicrobiaceae bacterium]|nr:hypothetical protein [Lentimicrobiaceae bacterium]
MTTGDSRENVIWFYLLKTIVTPSSGSITTSVSGGGSHHYNGGSHYRNGGSYYRNDGSYYRNGGKHHHNGGIILLSGFQACRTYKV